MKPCILIPHYNSRGAVAGVLARLVPLGVPVVVVDDGSEGTELVALRDTCRTHDVALLLEGAVNAGKGAAVKRGFLAAQELGYTHAVQVDADGQHRIEDIPRFLEAAGNCPKALVLCAPRYGADVPLGRLIGRQISRVWCWIETLSFAISDPLIGFRVYPLEPCVDLVKADVLGDRMEFDLQVAVRLCWLGTPTVNIASDIQYPDGGVSHFRMLSDNLRLSGAHTRLVFGMLVRMPGILLRKAAP